MTRRLLTVVLLSGDGAVAAIVGPAHPRAAGDGVGGGCCRCLRQPSEGFDETLTRRPDEYRVPQVVRRRQFGETSTGRS